MSRHQFRWLLFAGLGTSSSPPRRLRVTATPHLGTVLSDLIAEVTRMAPEETSSLQAKTISVEIPDGLPPSVVTAYVVHCLAALPALKVALDRAEHDDLRRFGHRLKGSGVAYGFPQLSALGSVIEMAATEGDPDELRRQLAALEAYLSRLDCHCD